MGVADNRTYKQEYLFKDDINYNVGADYPSIHEDPKVNTTIKENPYRSNVEIEGGELMLQPDLSALFKASGKKHSKGGMDVLLKPDSFIFSDYKGLAFTDKDHEMFELKDGGKTKDPMKNTPAEVLKRNVDVKHYNTLVSILDDPYKDDLAKKTAAMMLEKYIQTLGNVAYVQEEKKGFPDGLPEFSMGTAPVYNAELKQEIMANKQYMRAGGTINNPYQPKAQMGMIFSPQRLNSAAAAYNNTITPPPQNPQTAAQANTGATGSTPPEWGPWQGDKLPIFQDRYGVTNAADKFGAIKNWDAVTQKLGYTGPKNNLDFQHWLYNSSPENKAIIDKYHNQYNKGPNAGMFDKHIGIRWASAINDIMKRNPPTNTEDQLQIDVTTPSINKKQIPGPEVPNLNVTPQGSKQADWRFTPWQKLSQLNQLGQYASVRRYMPYRSRYNATYVDPALVNPEQAVGDIKGIANQQLSSVSTLNPILRNAQAASISGQVLNTVPGVRSQYDNQNASIINSNRGYNNQVKNNESLINMGNDQTYYTQAVEGRKNFENMRTHLFNNYANNLMRDVETNQKLSYNLLTQNNPAYGFDWRTGNFTRNNKSILDAQNPSNTQENLLDLAQNLKTQGYSDKLIGDIIKSKTFQQWQPAQTPNFFKKGGKVKKRNPYSY